MRINNLGANKTEVSHNDGLVVFYSYKTPVAALLPSGRYVKTSEKFSRTTSKHINEWLSGVGNVETIDQTKINELAGA